MSQPEDRQSPTWPIVVRAAVFVALLTGNLFPSLGPVSLATAGAVLAAPLVVWEIFRALPRVHPALPVTILVFGVLIVPGLLSPPVLPYGEEKFGKILTVTLLSALAATLIRDRRHLRVLAWVWLAAACVLAVATLATGGDSRATTFDSNPIWLGRELVSGLLVAIWLGWQRHLHPVLTFLVVALIGGALAATESRGPLVGAALALVVCLVVVRPRLSQLGWACLAFAAAGVVALFSFSPQVVPERFLALLLDPSASVDSSRRNEMWASTMPVIEQNPGGIGYGNWQTFTLQTHAWPHNLFLEVFAEAGWIPGAVMVAVTAWVLVRLFLRARTDAAATLVAMLLTASTVGVSISGDLNARTFFALLILGAVVARLAKPQASAGPARNAPRALDRWTQVTVPST